MAHETARRWNRSQVAKALGRAVTALRRAAEAESGVAMAMEQVRAALAAVDQGQKLAQHKTLPGEVKVRSGLPAPIRRALTREAGHLEKLLEQVRATPLTQGERALAKKGRIK